MVHNDRTVMVSPGDTVTDVLNAWDALRPGVEDSHSHRLALVEECDRLAGELGEALAVNERLVVKVKRWKSEARRWKLVAGRAEARLGAVERTVAAMVDACSRGAR
jgi:hypothetical protein